MPHPWIAHPVDLSRALSRDPSDRDFFTTDLWPNSHNTDLLMLGTENSPLVVGFPQTKDRPTQKPTNCREMPRHIGCSLTHDDRARPWNADRLTPIWLKRRLRG